MPSRGWHWLIAVMWPAKLRHILADMNGITKVNLLTPQDDSARVFTLFPAGNGIGVLFQNNQFELRDLKGKTLWQLPPARATAADAGGATSKVLGFAFADTGGRTATVSTRGELQVWSAQGRRILQTRHSDLAGLPPFFLGTRLHFSPDGHRLAFIDKQDSLRMLDLNQSITVVDPSHFPASDESVNTTVIAVRFNPDGRGLAAATKEGRVLCFDATSGRKLPAPTSSDRSGQVFSMEFDGVG